MILLGHFYGSLKRLEKEKEWRKTLLVRFLYRSSYLISFYYPKTAAIIVIGV